MARILIKNGRVWDGSKFFFADVLINGDNIEKIKANIAEPLELTIDATGKIVSSGLIDIHAHLLVQENDSFGTPADASCFPFGVTSVVDAGRTSGDYDVLNAFKVKNLIFVTAYIQKNHVRFDLLEEAIIRYKDKVVGIKVYFDTTQSEVINVTPLAEICKFAKFKNLRVMVHCANSPTPLSEILEMLNENDILTHSFHGGINNASEDDYKSIVTAQKRGVIIDTGFAGNVHTDFSIFKNAIKKGVLPNTISTDITKYSAFTRGGNYGMTMCMSMAKFMGMTEEAVFKSVTSTPSKILGKSKEWGFLKEGRKADIAILEFTNEGFSLTDKNNNHIESENGYRCILTILNGQVVYKY
ncbi:MAG: amidohydrolase family protein [Clostridia bacterium]|nr:amidohydrolase family protein [Clostridia bacterium]